MYAKAKTGSVPSDIQAREKLAMYVYEYLQHCGAREAAKCFLQEIGWEKNISLGDSPGFLHGWWCVFWDLYCASPEKRDTMEHSPEAKAFHDYSAQTNQSPMTSGGGMAGDVMCGGGPPGNPYFQAFVGGPRYPHGGPRPGMPPGHHPSQMGMPGGMDHPRQSHILRMMHGRSMHPGGPNWNGGGPPDQYPQGYGGMHHRIPGSHPGHMPMSMHPGSRGSQWPPGNGPNPGGPQNNAGGPPNVVAAGQPGTPIMRSPAGVQRNQASSLPGRPQPQLPSPATGAGSNAQQQRFNSQQDEQQRGSKSQPDAQLSGDFMSATSQGSGGGSMPSNQMKMPGNNPQNNNPFPLGNNNQMMENQVGMATNQQNGNNGNQAGGDNLMDVGGLTKTSPQNGGVATQQMGGTPVGGAQQPQQGNTPQQPPPNDDFDQMQLGGNFPNSDNLDQGDFLKLHPDDVTKVIGTPSGGQQSGTSNEFSPNFVTHQ